MSDNNDPSKIPPKLTPPPIPPPNMPPLPGGGKLNPYGKLTREVSEQVVKRLLVEGIVKGVKIALKGSVRVVTEVASQTADESKAAVDRTAMAKRLGTTVEGIQSLDYAAKSRNLDVGVLFQAVENIKNLKSQAASGDSKAKSAFKAFDISEGELNRLRPELVFKKIMEGVEPGKANAARLNASAFLLGDQYEDLRKYFNRDIPGLMDEFIEKGLAIDYVTTRNVAQFHDNLADWKGYAQTAYEATKEVAANTYNKVMDPVRSWKARMGARFSKLLAKTISFAMQTANVATMYVAEPLAEISDTAQVAGDEAVVAIGGDNGPEEVRLNEDRLKHSQAAQTDRENKEQARAEEKMRAAEEAQAATRNFESYGRLNLADSSANTISSNLAPQILDTQAALLLELRELSQAVERNTQVIEEVLGGP